MVRLLDAAPGSRGRGDGPNAPRTRGGGELGAGEGLVGTQKGPAKTKQNRIADFIPSELQISLREWENAKHVQSSCAMVLHCVWLVPTTSRHWYGDSPL